MPSPLSDFDRGLRKALLESVHRGGTSVKALAAELERTEKHVYAALHPYPESAGDGGRAVPSIHWLVPLIRLTGDAAPLQMIAEAVGYTLTALPAPAPSVSVQVDYLGAAAQVGDIARDMERALDKGGDGGAAITAAEWDLIEKDAMEAVTNVGSGSGWGVGSGSGSGWGECEGEGRGDGSGDDDGSGWGVGSGSGEGDDEGGGEGDGDGEGSGWRAPAGVGLRCE